MTQLRERLNASPLLSRVAPFVIFLLLTTLQGKLGPDSRFWVYAAKTVIGAWLVWLVWPSVTEMRWKLSWEAVVMGIAVFVLWVSLDSFYPKTGDLFGSIFGSGSKPPPEPWNPFLAYGSTAALAWFYVVVRIVGSAVVVPPIEEVFYRSFLYRYIAKSDFQSLPLTHFAWMPFLVTAGIFGFAHHEWLAGILCAAGYQLLVVWKGRLGDAMTAHAITNLLLGIWVVARGAWNFW